MTVVDVTRHRPSGAGLGPAVHLTGRLESQGQARGHDGIPTRTAVFRLVADQVAFGDVIVWGGDRYLAERIEPIPPFNVEANVRATMQPSAAMHLQGAVSRRELDTASGVAVQVDLERQTADVDDTTGERLFAAAVTVPALIAASSRRIVRGDGSIVTAQHRLTVYDHPVEVGDRITWAARAHTVLRVEGLVKDALGAVYEARCHTN